MLLKNINQKKSQVIDYFIFIVKKKLYYISCSTLTYFLYFQKNDRKLQDDTAL